MPLRDTHAGRRALPRPIQVVLAIETLDRLVEVAHEAGAAQLAVGKDLEPGPLLTIEDVEDVPILDAGQLVMRDIRVLARLEQFRRPQQTANLVRAIDGSHAVTFNVRLGPTPRLGRTRGGDSPVRRGLATRSEYGRAVRADVILNENRILIRCRITV